MKRQLSILTPLILLLFAAGPAAADSLGLNVLSLQDEQESIDPAEELRYESREMRVRIWHDKEDEEVYERGEPLRLYFRANDDAYVVAYRIDADGYTEVLWPTSRFDDGFAFGGHTYTLPARGSSQRLRASMTKGVEYVEVIASQYPFDLRNLGIDFRFDEDVERSYNHKVEGDPFLAVNDINYAITGLDEDVDYIVTDWAHIYVGAKVDYPRYSCGQCHTDEEDHHPYVDTCSQINIQVDYGWHTRWYSRFGYYPLYYDAPFYYWDYIYFRPYYYTYYPVYYSWPGYPLYVRTFPIYSWHDSRYYRGDYVVRYGRGLHGSRPLYASQAREISKGRRGRSRVAPPSVTRRDLDPSRAGRVREDQLAHNALPRRVRDGKSLDTVGSRTGGGRAGIRTNAPRSPRTIRSLKPDGPDRASIADKPRDRTIRGRTPVERGSSGRRWTQPVVRNRGGDGGRTLRSTEVRKPSQRKSTGQRSTVDQQRRRDDRSGDRKVQRRVEPRRREAPAKVKPRSSRRGERKSTPPPRQSVKRKGGGSSQPRSAPRSTVRSAPKQSSPKRVSPAPQRSAPRPKSTPKSSPKRGSSGKRGGSSKKGGGGRG